MSLLFNMLSRFDIAFLPRSKHFIISWLQSPSAVILEPKKIKSVTVSIVSPSICHEVMGPDAMIFVFWMLSFKSDFSLSSFTFIKRLFHFSSLPAIRVVHIWGYWYFSLKSWFQLVLHPSQHFSWCTLHMLSKQGDNIQPWCTPFPIWNQSIVLILTLASWLAYKFHRRQVRWSSLPISFRIFQFIVIHTVKGFGIINEAEDNFLEFSGFFYDPLAIFNLISGFSAFSDGSAGSKPAWTPGSCRFKYYWRLAWRILSITLLACKMNAIMW